MAQARTSSRSESSGARVGGGARIRGRIHGEGDLVVEGRVEGDLSIRGELTIAESGAVVGEAIEAQTISVSGTLEGDVASAGPVRFFAGSQVKGNVKGSTVAIDDGARFSGRLDCDFDLPPELGGSSRGETRGRPAARR